MKTKTGEERQGGQVPERQGGQVPCLIFVMITFYKGMGIFYPPSLFFVRPIQKFFVFLVE